VSPAIRRPPRLRGALSLLVLCGVSAAARADDALKLYQQGQQALEKGSCGDAAQAFRAAIAKDAKENGNKKDYGVIFVPYFPHLQLAKALLCSGDAAGARAALGHWACSLAGRKEGPLIGPFLSPRQRKD